MITMTIGSGGVSAAAPYPYSFPFRRGQGNQAGGPVRRMDDASNGNDNYYNFQLQAPQQPQQRMECQARILEFGGRSKVPRSRDGVRQAPVRALEIKDR
jgi:hypothetical protein